MQMRNMTVGLPVLWCDFNACGWSGEKGDTCYYVVGPQGNPCLKLTESMRAILYQEDSEELCTACEGVLERWKDRWRARPDVSTWTHLSMVELRRLQAYGSK